MTDVSGALPDMNEADAIEQAQGADGGLDDSNEDLEPDDPSDSRASRWDADQADVIEQAQTIKSDDDEEYPDSDEG